MGVIDDIKTNLGNAYTKLETKGATIPEYKNMENLEDTIDSVSVEKETQQKTVGLSMASGNQVVTPDADKVLSQVTIEKPATLNSENIKKDVNIGGVVGTLEEGITPTGNINITDTNQTDVTNYETAQVVEENLVPANIRSGISVLGVQGNMQSGITNYEVIDRPNALPTASATSPDFVQYNGKLYRKQISGGVPSTITDLTGTSWEFNNTLNNNVSGKSIDYYINFSSNYVSYTSIYFHYFIMLDQQMPHPIIEDYVNFDNTEIYNNGSWSNNAYKTISITGGTDATDTDLINWLQANATMQPTTTYEYVEVGGGNNYGWVDANETVVVSGQSGHTSLTNVDMSTVINNYDANGEYEALILFQFGNSAGDCQIGSDIITPHSIQQSVSDWVRHFITLPFNRYLKYKTQNSQGITYIILWGYRRIK